MKNLGLFTKQVINIILTIIIVSLMLVVSLDKASAKDFGSNGHVFAIGEEDILEVIKKQLAKVDLDELNQKMLKQTIDHVENPPAIVGITNYSKNQKDGNDGAKELKEPKEPKEAKELTELRELKKQNEPNEEKAEYYYDPTYVLDKDILDQNGKIMHYRGKKVNPLEFIPLRESLIFIDGDNEDQLKLALDIGNQKSKIDQRIKIILTKGSPLKIQRKHKLWIYFDQKGILTSKLGIKQVPALVEQAGLLLKIKLIDTGEYFK